MASDRRGIGTTRASQCDDELRAEDETADAPTDTLATAMVDREIFDLIKSKHGAYASWAVWATAGDLPKSNIGDLGVLDPDQNPSLLSTLRNDVVMLGLNLSRPVPVPFLNFHDPRPQGQDYKIRYAFTGTPYYGAYMTDLIKGVVIPDSADLVRHLASFPPLIREDVGRLLEEFEDLPCKAPVVIAFGTVAYDLAARYIPSTRYSRLVRVWHYSDYMAKEKYRERVLAEVDGSPPSSAP